MIDLLVFATSNSYITLPFPSLNEITDPAEILLDAAKDTEHCAELDAGVSIIPSVPVAKRYPPLTIIPLSESNAASSPVKDY